MITVQIASQLTARGVDGVRWVLLEDSDGLAAAEPPPAQSLPAATPVARSTGWLLGLKVLVIVAGLGAAARLAYLEFGAPVLRGQAPRPPAPAVTGPGQATPPATPATPASHPALVAGVNPR